MSNYNPNAVRLKLLIDKNTRKVVYGEAGKEFVDFLCTILTLPLGTVTKLLSGNHNMVGSIGRLSWSIDSLSSSFFQFPLPYQSTMTVPNPSGLYYFTNNTPLLPSDGLAEIRQLYTCPNTHDRKMVTENPQKSCMFCFKPMNSTVGFLKEGSSTTNSQEGGFVKGSMSFMVMDNLEVQPMSTVSILAAFTKFNIKDVSALEEKVIPLTSAEGLKLLKASLTTENVLTTVFIGALK